jgi:hypothetical protein
MKVKVKVKKFVLLSKTYTYDDAVAVYRGSALTVEVNSAVGTETKTAITVFDLSKVVSVEITTAQ